MKYRFREIYFWHGWFKLNTFFVLGASFILTACQTLPESDQPNQPGQTRSSHNHPAYFISIDGIRPDHARAMLDSKILPSDQGLGRLIENGKVSYSAQADVITLTAPSHASIITCSPPALHGIVANTFYAREPVTQKLEKQDGFFTHPKSETLWKAARRQGKKVLSLSYPDAATGSVDEQADVWVAFPPASKVEKGRIETLRWSKLSLAKDWILPTELSKIHLPSPDAREAELVLKLSPETTETRTIHVLIVNNPEPQIYFDDDKNLSNGHYGVLTEKHPGFVDFFFVELNPRSSTKEYKRHIYVRWLDQNHSDAIRLAVSASTYNYAYPESFRKDLDRANLVWPDAMIPDLEAEHTGISALEFVEWQYRLSRFLVDSYEVAKRQGPFDLVLFYQPMLDSFGHVYESQLPLPLNISTDVFTGTSKKSDVLEGYKLAMRLISHNIEDMVKDDVGRSPIVLVGDHGMEGVEAEINLARALPLPPNGIIFQPAGGMMLIYSDLKPEAWKTWYAKTVAHLRDLMWKNQPVLVSDEQRPGGNDSGDPAARTSKRDTTWNFGDAAAVLHSASHTQFVVRTEKEKVIDIPHRSGAHGYPVSDLNMSTLMIVNAPGVSRGVLAGGGQVQLRDAVPTLVSLMSIQPPAQCSGNILPLGATDNNNVPKK